MANWTEQAENSLVKARAKVAVNGSQTVVSDKFLSDYLHNHKNKDVLDMLTQEQLDSLSQIVPEVADLEEKMTVVKTALSSIITDVGDTLLPPSDNSENESGEENGEA